MSAEIILDTNALRLLADDEFIEKIKNECHNLVIPNVRSEIGSHFSNFISLIQRIGTELRGKFILFERADRVPRDIKRDLKNHRADENDVKVTGTAIRRRNKTGRPAIIVTNDSAFHQSHRLRNIIKVVYVDEALDVLDC